MYELKAGTARLVSVLYARKDDAATVKRLAAVLNYLPEQLAQDIQALSDFYQRAGKERTEEE